MQIRDRVKELRRVKAELLKPHVADTTATPPDPGFRVAIFLEDDTHTPVSAGYAQPATDPDFAGPGVYEFTFPAGIFLPDGSKGWACGVNGRVLETTNLGDDWSLNLDQVMTLTNNCEPATAPATLWRSRFLNATQGFTCGLWTFKYTANGQNWSDVRIYDSLGGGELTNRVFEFYTLALLQIGGQLLWQLLQQHSRRSIFVRSQPDTSLQLL